jgi:hypothetical protein
MKETLTPIKVTWIRWKIKTVSLVKKITLSLTFSDRTVTLSRRRRREITKSIGRNISLF